MAVIGKIYGDAGLRDLLIESSISTEGRIEQVLRGKHCSNAMFAHLCVYESLYRLKIKLGYHERKIPNFSRLLRVK